MEIKEKIKMDKFTHSVRASQSVLQYGVGAMVDFPEQTLMTAAPETWESSVKEIHDQRLEKEVLHVDFIGMPGSADELRYQNGISFTRFPEWYFCPKCRSFKPIKEWYFDYAHSTKMKKRYEKDPNMVKRVCCTTCFQDLVVSRIVVACGQGHIDDFPWVKWVHARNFGGAKPICQNPKIKFKTTASSSEGLEGLTVICENCNSRTTLKGAFDQNAFKELNEKTGNEYNFRCTGRHPWKNCSEQCIEFPHVLQRGSSSVYFPKIESSIVIPPYSSQLNRLIEDSVGYSNFKKSIKDSLNAFKLANIEITQEQREQIVKSKIQEFSKIISNEIGRSVKLIEPILERSMIQKTNSKSMLSTKSVNYKAEEYVALNGEVIADDNGGDFVLEETRIEDYGIPYLKKICLIHKIREVQALVGFSRLEPVEQNEDNKNNKIKLVDIKEEETNWYPGYEVRGEGIFIEFDEDSLNKWRTDNHEIDRRVQLVNDNYAKSYFGSKKQRVITSKFLLLHTISHLLMKQLSFECGYNIASIKERIYCSEAYEGRSMSGILIYTASGDSEGTMGGLVRQGRSDVFPHLFKKAIESAMTCSNDPVCSLSQGQGRDSLNMSACYSCTLVPETSCEEFNVFLDRGAVIGTFENPNIGLYSQYVKKWDIDINSKDFENDVNYSQEKSKQNKKTIVIKDYGVIGSGHESVWMNLSQFADSEEKNKIEELLKNISKFEKLERPGCNGTFTDAETMNDYNVDLIWKKSKVMVFTAENEEEYLLAKDSDWKCFSIKNDDFNWKVLNDSIQGV